MFHPFGSNGFACEGIEPLREFSIASAVRNDLFHKIDQRNHFFRKDQLRILNAVGNHFPRTGFLGEF